jgi:hypothetical protein
MEFLVLDWLPCSQSDPHRTLPTCISWRATELFIESRRPQYEWRRWREIDCRTLKSGRYSSPIVLEMLYETLLVGNRKPGNGNDFYPGDTFTRTDWCVDTRQDRVTEENSCREGATSDWGMIRLLIVVGHTLRHTRRKRSVLAGPL